MAAFALRRNRVLAVEPEALPTVERDLVVTIETKRGLGFLLEGRVALVAAVFVFLMRLRQRTWHDEFLKQSLPQQCRR